MDWAYLAIVRGAKDYRFDSGYVYLLECFGRRWYKRYSKFAESDGVREKLADADGEIRYIYHWPYGTERCSYFCEYSHYRY